MGDLRLQRPLLLQSEVVGGGHHGCGAARCQPVWLHQVQSGQQEEFNQHGHVLPWEAVSKTNYRRRSDILRRRREPACPSHWEQLSLSNSVHIARRSVGFVFPLENFLSKKKVVFVLSFYFLLAFGA